MFKIWIKNGLQIWPGFGPDMGPNLVQNGSDQGAISKHHLDGCAFKTKVRLRTIASAVTEEI